MNLVKRMQVLAELRDWWQSEDEQWKRIRKRAEEHNKWFTEEFIDNRIHNILTEYLDDKKLKAWVDYYSVDDNISSRNVGIVMAGNIPLVGFHDLLCAFVAGHHAHIKLSEKDSILLREIVDKMKEIDPDTGQLITFADILKGCDAYIATGSNNTSRYFEYYFGRYPSVIRKNKTSVAILDGHESQEELELLADDVFMYFGLGCRNVTQIFVPRSFDFQRLMQAFSSKYGYLKDHTRFRNNYDYNLALLIMNNREYMSNESIILVEGDHLFSPVSELYYAMYDDKLAVADAMSNNDMVQCIVGDGFVSAGQTQRPDLFDYADGVDTMQFLLSI